MAFESKYTLPLVGVSRAASRCKRVLLPAPEGATIAIISPCRKVKFASTKTWTRFSPLPYVFFKPRDSRTTRVSHGSPEDSALAAWVSLIMQLVRLWAFERLVTSLQLDASPAISVYWAACHQGASQDQKCSHFCQSFARQEKGSFASN